MDRSSTARRGLPPATPDGARTYDEELIARRQRFSLTKSKLSRVSEIASFMGGFCVVAMVETQIPDPPNHFLLTAFAVTTTLLASCCGYIIMFAAWIRPQLHADEELDFVLIETQLVKQYQKHRLFKMEKMIRYCVQIGWILSSVGSVFLFTLDVIIVFWLKYSHSKPAVYSATAILTPVLVIFLCFAFLFRKRLIKNKLFARVAEDEDEKNEDDDELMNFSKENERYLAMAPSIISDRRRPSTASSLGNFVSPPPSTTSTYPVSSALTIGNNNIVRHV